MASGDAKSTENAEDTVPFHTHPETPLPPIRSHHTGESSRRVMNLPDQVASDLHAERYQGMPLCDIASETQRPGEEKRSSPVPSDRGHSPPPKCGERVPSLLTRPPSLTLSAAREDANQSSTFTEAGSSDTGSHTINADDLCEDCLEKQRQRRQARQDSSASKIHEDAETSQRQTMARSRHQETSSSYPAPVPAPTTGSNVADLTPQRHDPLAHESESSRRDPTQVSSLGARMYRAAGMHIQRVDIDFDHRGRRLAILTDQAPAHGPADHDFAEQKNQQPRERLVQRPKSPYKRRISSVSVMPRPVQGHTDAIPVEFMRYRQHRGSDIPGPSYRHRNVSQSEVTPMTSDRVSLHGRPRALNAQQAANNQQWAYGLKEPLERPSGPLPPPDTPSTFPPYRHASPTAPPPYPLTDDDFLHPKLDDNMIPKLRDHRRREASVERRNGVRVDSYNPAMAGQARLHNLLTPSLGLQRPVPGRPASVADVSSISDGLPPSSQVGGYTMLSVPAYTGRDSRLDDVRRFGVGLKTRVTLMKPVGVSDEEWNEGGDSDIIELPDPEERQPDSVVRLVFPEANIFLSQEQLAFDSPNIITKVLERDAPKDAERTILMKINVPNRSHIAFLAFIYDYLSGFESLPLSLRQVADLQPLCDEKRGALDVLYAEAIFWGFTTLQMDIHREVNGSPTRSGATYTPTPTARPENRHTPERPGPHEPVNGGESGSSEAASGILRVEDLLSSNIEELSKNKRTFFTRILCSQKAVRTWLDKIQRGPPLLKPTNSTLFKTQGWMSGRMFTIGKVEEQLLAFEIEANEPAYSEGKSWKLDMSVAIKNSTSELRRVTELALDGGIFHTCMQAIPGRKGLRLYYKADWIFVTVPPMRVLRDLMVVGWWERSMPRITSHRPDLMQRPTNHSSWSMNLPSSIEKSIFDEYGLDEAKVIFRLSRPTQDVRYLEY